VSRTVEVDPMTPNRSHRAPRRPHISGKVAAVSAVVLGSAALAVAGGAGPAGAAPSTAELSQTVVIADNHFTPDDVGVHVGDKVTWTNTDEVAHAVNAVSGPEPFGTGREALHNGESYTWRFDRAGLYHYVDNLNHGMRGTVRVGRHEQTNTPPSDDWSSGSLFGPGRPPNHGPR
jgi:plastocyanin